MARADDDVVGEKSTFRWLDAARYALAFVVTVLIVTVIAHAIVVVLRPESLILRVIDRGFVSAERSNLSARYLNLTFHFSLQAINPSGRVRIYYTGIIVYLRGSTNASTSPADDFLAFPVDDLAVAQLSTVESNTVVSGDMYEQFQKPYFDMLYNNRSIPDAVMWLNGTLTVEVYSGHNNTGRTAIYCCSGLTVGGDSSDQDTAGDVLCAENSACTNT